MKEIDRDGEEPPSIPDAILRRVVCVADSKVELQSNAHLFNMARDNALGDYERDQEPQCREAWQTLESVILGQPLDSLRSYHDPHRFHDDSEVYIPPHMVLEFYKIHKQDGQEVALRTYIHGLDARPCERYDYCGEEFGATVGHRMSSLKRMSIEHASVRDIVKRKAFTDSLTGLEATKVGFRTYEITADELRAELERIMRQQRRALLDAINHYYVVMTVSGVDANPEDQEVIFQAGIGRVDFEREKYEQYLPSWDNFLYGGLKHPVFTQMPEDSDYFDFMSRELPKYIPNRQQSYETLTELIELLYGSAPVSNQNGYHVGIYGEQRTAMMESLDFLADLDEPYCAPYKR